jgi:hypothetical protein
VGWLVLKGNAASAKAKHIPLDPFGSHLENPLEIGRLRGSRMHGSVSAIATELTRGATSTDPPTQRRLHCWLGGATIKSDLD